MNNKYEVTNKFRDGFEKAKAPNRRIPVSQSIDTTPTQITINVKSFPKIKTVEESVKEDEQNKTGRRSFLDFL